eukprot:1195082-Prorocentrum_minimum.AAC.15
MMSPWRRTPRYHCGPMRCIFTSSKPAFVNHSMYSCARSDPVRRGRGQEQWQPRGLGGRGGVLGGGQTDWTEGGRRSLPVAGQKAPRVASDCQGGGWAAGVCRGVSLVLSRVSHMSDRTGTGMWMGVWPFEPCGLWA